MLETILQDFADLMKTRVLEITAVFEKNLDFGALEIAITKELAILGAALQKALLTVLLEGTYGLAKRMKHWISWQEIRVPYGTGDILQIRLSAKAAWIPY